MKLLIVTAAACSPRAQRLVTVADAHSAARMRTQAYILPIVQAAHRRSRFKQRLAVHERSEWTRRESNPCPKIHPLSFYDHSGLFPGSAPVFPRTRKSPLSFVRSSFMIRPLPQSLSNVVSRKVDAGYPMCGCTGADAPLKRRALNYLQRLCLGLRSDAPSRGSLLQLQNPCRNLDWPVSNCQCTKVVFFTTFYYIGYLYKNHYLNFSL